MRKFTLFLSLFFAMALTAMAQSYSLTETRLSSAELNAKTASTYIAIKNLSATNNFYFVGNTGAAPYSVADFTDAAVFVWEPVFEGEAGSYYLKKLDGTYMQASSPKDFGSIEGAAVFTTTNPTQAGEGSSNFNGDGDSMSYIDAEDMLVRFVNNAGTWINVQNGAAGTPTYNQGKGGWTIHYVYAVEAATVEPEPDPEPEPEPTVDLVWSTTEVGTAPYQLPEEDAAKIFALSDLTVAVKVTTPATLADRKAIFCTSDPTQAANTDAMPTGSAYVAYGTSGANLSYLASCKTGDRYSSGTVPAGAEDVVLVYVLNPTNNNFKAYINGVSVMDRNFGGYEIATPKMVKEDHAGAQIYIGGGMTAEGAMELFDGTISAVSVYSGVLSAEEIANLFAPSQEEVDAAAAALKEVTDKAAALLAEAQLSVEATPVALQTTDAEAAAYVTCPQEHNANNGDTDGDGVPALVDGNTGTFMHTSWGVAIDGPHYIQIDLGEGNSIQNFSFNYHTRVNGGSDFPDAIEVQGSNDGEAFTTITKIESGLPQAGDKAWASNVISAAEAYSHLRFLVTAERIYWHMSEFGISNVVSSVAEEFKAAFDDVVALDAEYKRIMANEAMSIKEMNAAAEALAALIATVEAGRVTPEPEPSQPTTAEFDFTNPTALEPSVTPNETVSAGVEFDDITFTNNGVSVNVNKGAATTKVRIWTKKGPAYELRSYTGSTITVSAPVGTKLTSIVFEGKASTKMTAEGFDAGTWTGEAESVEFAVTGTLNINTIKVELVVEGGISVSAPVPSVESGVYPEALNVSFVSEIAGVEEGTEYTLRYYYTDNGDEPTAASNRIYSNLYVGKDATYKVIAVLTIGEEQYVSPVTEVSYIISEMKPYEAIKSAEDVKPGKVIMVAGTQAALSVEGKYGYLNAREVEVKGSFVEDMVYYAFELEAAEGGYYIKDANGKYLYMSGTYNSFNVSDEVPAEAGVWTIAINEDGTATITNVEKAKYIQYSTKYSSYGAYAEAQAEGVLPTLYAQGEYPVLEYTPTGEEMLSELKEFTFTCAQGLSVNVEAGVPFVYDPMSGVWSDEVGDYVYSKYFELDATVVDANTVVLSLPEAVTGEGFYQLSVPAGFFVLNPEGLAIASEAIGDYYNLVDNSPLTIESTTPAVGVVESLSRVEIDFSHNVGEVYNPISVVDAEGNEVCKATPSFQDAEGNWYNDYSLVSFVLESEITAAGTYSLVIPANYINKTSDGSFFEGATLTFTIEGEVETGLADGVYKLHWEWNGRGFMAYHEDFPEEAKLADVTLGGYENIHYNSATDNVDLNWYLITANDGNRYLFHVATGKFLTYTDVEADAAVSNRLDAASALAINIETSVADAASYQVTAEFNDKTYLLSSGCGASSFEGHPIRWNPNMNDLTDGGTPVKFVPVEGVEVSDEVMAAVNAVINPVKYYRVKHVTSGKYLHINERNADYSTGPIGSVIVSDFAEVSDQVFSIEENENGKYLVSSEGYYIVCRAWNVDAWNDATMGSALAFEATKNEGEFYIKCANGYFKVENVGGVDYPFCDAPITAAATWVLEEAEAPAPVEPVEFGVVSIDPADGSTVSSLTTITVTFSHAVSCDALRPGIDTYNIFGDNGSVNESHFSIEGNVVKFELISGIYDAGVYTLSIPKYIFSNAETGEVFEGAKFLFTVDGTLSGIGNVNAEDGNQVIYDLNGRRVKNAVKGVYIINGKKVLVK